MKNHNNFIIPAQALELAHFKPDSPLAVHCGENTLVVVPESMTALQAANTITVLTEIISDLLDVIKEVCGSCEDQLEDAGCPYEDACVQDECPFETVRGPGVTLTDEARKEMGIPLDAKLEFFPDKGEGLVAAADYKHDITDVPEEIRALLVQSGICLGRLDEVIMAEKEVWHG